MTGKTEARSCQCCVCGDKHLVRWRGDRLVRDVHAEPQSGECYPGVRNCLNCLSRVDLICGGFPCQDVSVAGKGKGLAGERSGLWREFARIVDELRPTWVLIENVPALRTRGRRTVLSDLHACGYDAEWDGVPASAFGAPHRRDRLFIVAYFEQQQLRQQPGRGRWENGRLIRATGEQP